MALEGIEDLSQETQDLLDGGNLTETEYDNLDKELEEMGKVLLEDGLSEEDIKKILEEKVVSEYKDLDVIEGQPKEITPGEKYVDGFKNLGGINFSSIGASISLNMEKLNPGANISYTNSKGEEIIVSTEKELEEFISVAKLNKKDEKDAKDYFDLYIKEDTGEGIDW